ncbi:putative MFS family arabinose efflux permease [Kribbella voronezhensis]|uniref:Putative MFS family arabinose efflux permease n=1 Tax=Kribbella voronezhensis TaxID=2512212 RepID=A0A4R7T7W6_9ACTN|nr:MFS transporter [Kribbella voronezhensis]TDU87994.1 putative MFS family arabinose efflux permease [Kribbella voronezhensis]
MPSLRHSELIRYLVVAVAMRVANDGAVVGLSLLAFEVLPGTAEPTTIAGFLVAALVAPHLAGPWIASMLAKWRDTRPLLAGAFAGYGVAVAAATVLLGSTAAVFPILAALIAGCAGPFLGGGLTSRLPKDATRALALDSATWGIATAAGPATAAALALTVGTRTAMLIFAGTAVLAGVLALALPAVTGSLTDAPVLRTADVVRLVSRNRLLIRAIAAIGIAGLGMGTLRVAAPLLGLELGRGSAQGGVLIALYGLGSLAGSLLVAARPFKARPDRATGLCLAVMALALAGAAAAPAYWLAQASFVLLGLANGPFLAATLTACVGAAPTEAPAQVLILSSTLRIPAAAAAGVLAGFAGGAGASPILLASAVALVLAAAAASFLRPLPQSPALDAEPAGEPSRCGQ